MTVVKLNPDNQKLVDEIRNSMHRWVMILGSGGDDREVMKLLKELALSKQNTEQLLQEEYDRHFSSEYQLKHDIEVYREVLGYKVSDNLDGLLTDGTRPVYRRNTNVKG